MSNIAAGNKSHVEALFQESRAIKALMDIASQGKVAKVESILRISKLCTNEWVTPEEIGILVGCGVIKTLLMACEEPMAIVNIRLVPKALGTVLKVDGDGELYQAEFVDPNGVSTLESSRHQMPISKNLSTSCLFSWTKETTCRRQTALL